MLEGKIVKAITKLSMLGGDVNHQMTQAKVHHIVSNDLGVQGVECIGGRALRKHK